MDKQSLVNKIVHVISIGTHILTELMTTEKKSANRHEIFGYKDNSSI